MGEVGVGGGRGGYGCWMGSKSPSSLGSPQLEGQGGEAPAQITLTSGVQPPWCNHAHPQPPGPGCSAARVWGLPACPSVLLLDQSGFLVSLVTRSTSADWALPAGPGAAVAEETLQPSWALAGEGGWYWEAPSPASSLLEPMPSRPAVRLKLLGRLWGGEASLGALKPHPDCAELQACRAPGGLGYSQGAEPPGVPKTGPDCGTDVITVGWGAMGWDRDLGLGEGSQDWKEKM